MNIHGMIIPTERRAVLLSQPIFLLLLGLVLSLNDSFNGTKLGQKLLLVISCHAVISAKEDMFSSLCCLSVSNLAQKLCMKSSGKVGSRPVNKMIKFRW